MGVGSLSAFMNVHKSKNYLHWLTKCSAVHIPAFIERNLVGISYELTHLGHAIWTAAISGDG